MPITFPDGFVFGASTASYQIEGAWDEDGRGESIWDRFCRTPGAVKDGDTGDVACDHYHRYAEDLDLARQAGMSVYRFSIAWPRLFPSGRGAKNAKGFDFYDRLTDACLARGIEPWPCFYHWDLPQALQEVGGWENRDVARWYVDYAVAAAERLADRAPKFVMFNEPAIFTSLGYQRGYHAPGVRSRAAYGAAVHHVNLATADGVRALREAAPKAELGTVLSQAWIEPANDRQADLEAAERADAFANLAFADTLFHGRYPDAVFPTVEPFIQAGDLERLQAKIDFLGVNHYSRNRVEGLPEGKIRTLRPPAGAPLTEMGWEIWPEGMTKVLTRLSERYGPIPLYVTENGMAGRDDRRLPDGRLDDGDRVSFLHDYIAAAHAALAAGADLRGYLVWSLLDNFEWAEGYAKRFGIVEVDYATLKRTPKRSYAWFSELAQTRTLPEVEAGVAA